MHSRNSARSQMSGRDRIRYSPPGSASWLMSPQRTASSARLDCNYWKARRAQSRLERGPLLHGSGIRSHLCEHPRRCYQAIGQIAVHNYVASTPAFLRGASTWLPQLLRVPLPRILSLSDCDPCGTSRYWRPCSEQYTAAPRFIFPGRPYPKLLT